MIDTAPNKIATLKKSWQESALAPLVKRFGERKSVFTTSDEHMVVDTVYTPEGDAGGYMEKLGFPGEFPFTRGVQPNMYRGRFWTMRQYAGFGNAAEIQRALQIPDRPGADRPLRGLRPAHADRL